MSQRESDPAVGRGTNSERLKPLFVTLPEPGPFASAAASAIVVLARLVGRRPAWVVEPSEVPRGSTLLCIGNRKNLCADVVVLTIPESSAEASAAPEAPWRIVLRDPRGEPVAFRSRPIRPLSGGEAAPWLPRGYQTEGSAPTVVRRAGAATYLEVDVIGDTAHLLASAEEYGFDRPDRHGRFPMSASPRAALGLLRHPLVHYYAELIRAILSETCPGERWTPPQPVVVLSHDIDNVTSRHPRVVLGHASSAVRSARRGSVRGVGRALKLMGRSLLGPERWWTFSRIREIERRHGARSTFYFLGGSGGRFGARYRWERPDIREVMRGLRADGCVVGLHMDYYAHGRPAEMARLRAELEGISGGAVVANRSHYLRFRVPESWREFGEAGIMVDSTVGYAEAEGFRSGVAAAFRPHDLHDGTPMAVAEIPLIAMDSAMFEGRDDLEVVRDVLELAERLRGTASALTLLWHERAFDPEEFGPWGRAYEELLCALAQMGFGFSTDLDVADTFLADEAEAMSRNSGR